MPISETNIGSGERFGIGMKEHHGPLLHIRQENVRKEGRPYALSLKNPPPVHHRRIDWDVARRLLKIVYLDGKIKRTNLAMRVGINYTACTRYVAWMLEINWISLSEDNQVRLTESGLQICKRLFLDN